MTNGVSMSPFVDFRASVGAEPINYSPVHIRVAVDAFDSGLVGLAVVFTGWKSHHAPASAVGNLAQLFDVEVDRRQEIHQARPSQPWPNDGLVALQSALG
jgi:hypothetical protein